MSVWVKQECPFSHAQHARENGRFGRSCMVRPPKTPSTQIHVTALYKYVKHTVMMMDARTKERVYSDLPLDRLGLRLKSRNLE